MTIIRWDRDERLGFPKPIFIRGRKYRRLSELIEFEERQAKDPQVTHGSRAAASAPATRPPR